MATGLTIWANPFLIASSEELLIRSTGAHKLILAQKAEHVLDVGTLDPRLLQAEIVFGQPDPRAIIQSKKLRWLQLSSAGYARYDNQEIRSVLKERAATMTNSSSVYDEPCAEHLMAWLLADARQLYPAYDNQRGLRGWPQNELRENTRLLAAASGFHHRLWRDRASVNRASRSVFGSGDRLSASPCSRAQTSASSALRQPPEHPGHSRSRHQHFARQQPNATFLQFREASANQGRCSLLQYRTRHYNGTGSPGGKPELRAPPWPPIWTSRIRSRCRPIIYFGDSLTVISRRTREGATSMKRIGSLDISSRTFVGMNKAKNLLIAYFSFLS